MPTLSHQKIPVLQSNQSTEKAQRLWFILGLRGGLFLVELGVGFWGHSLSLLAGAGHLFSDLVVLGLTLVIAWLVQHQIVGESDRKYRRMEAAIALLNGLSLGVIACLIVSEALKDLQTPKPILALPVLLIAALSLVVNGVTLQLLRPHTRNNLNFRGIFLHGLADGASALSIILAACAVYFFGWLWADAVGSLLVALFISLGAISLIREGLQVLWFEVLLSHQEDTLAE